MASRLTDATRAATAAKLREAATLLDAGDEAGAGKMILSGIPAVVTDLKTALGPMWLFVRDFYVKPFLSKHLG